MKKHVFHAYAVFDGKPGGFVGRWKTRALAIDGARARD